MAATSDPDTSNVSLPVAWTSATKPSRSTIVSIQSAIICSASLRVRPCVIASSSRISASQKPAGVRLAQAITTIAHQPASVSA